MAGGGRRGQLAPGQALLHPAPGAGRNPAREPGLPIPAGGGEKLVVCEALEIFLACPPFLSLAISLGISLSRHTGNNWGCSARPQAVDQQSE